MNDEELQADGYDPEKIEKELWPVPPDDIKESSILKQGCFEIRKTETTWTDWS